MNGDVDDGQALASVLVDVRTAAAGTSFDLEQEGAAAARQDRDALVHQVDDYVLPRLRSLDAPLLAVVGGSTGAGKSTLVNTIVGREVSPAGVLRPTTRAPVLICHPSDQRWFADDRVLPGLARTTGGSGGPGTVQLEEADSLSPGLALLDAPDIDSVVTANRDLAKQLLAAADLWVFVTTAARYADAVPWDLLLAARDRGSGIAVVLDRVPPEALGEVTADLRRMLDEHGLSVGLLHPVREATLVEGRLPDVEAAPVQAWLTAHAADAGTRAEVVRTTLGAVLSGLDRRLADLAAAAARQQETAAALAAEVDAAYGSAHGEVDRAVRDGTLLRGEVLARWEEFVGTGELMRTVQARVGMVRDRIRAAVTGRPTSIDGVQVAVENGVESLVHAAADAAAEQTVLRWRGTTAGQALVAGQESDLGRASAELLAQLPDQVREWQGVVLDLVRAQGAGKRTSARVASYTVNGAGLAVMLAVFAQTGGLTGAELAVAGGTSAASQKIIEAVFGDQAVRALARDARQDLLGRVEALLDADAGRFHARLAASRPEEAAGLTDAFARWQDARRRTRL